jgi:hypothetical protein
VKKLPPFLPGLSPKLQGRRRRRQLENLRRSREEAIDASRSELAALFHDILPADWLASVATDIRESVYTQVVVFWAWLHQALEQNESCVKALTRVEGWREARGQGRPAFDTSAYCKARGRLPEEFLDKIHGRVEAFAEARVEGHHLWRGLRIKAIDGTSVKLMDTPENQAEFPQPSGQAKGCGFPVMGIVGVLDLARGTLSDFVTCPYRQHDIRGFYQLRGHFKAGDLAVGDRAFCSYEMLALLSAGGAQSVMRLHQRRNGKRDWRSGRRIGEDSSLVVWRKPARRGKAGLSDEEWEALPETMELRYVRTEAVGRDGKPRTIYLVTTLLDPEAYPDEEIAAVYHERWEIEVKIRDIKTTMKFEMLRVRTPAMARRTVRMIQIAYNLIKARQAEAIRGEAIGLGELGFKATLDLLDESLGAFAGLLHRPRLLAGALALFEERLRERTIPIRPGRQEPRAVKARPKPYQYLTKPRHEFTETQHRGKYRKVA